MVDPNRKINRLSDDDAAFLRECEQEFRNRFTDNDDEFIAFCEKAIHPPPIVSPWQTGRRNNQQQDSWRNNYRAGGSGGGGGGGGGGYNNRNNYQNRRNNDYVQRNPRQFHNRNRGPYDRNDRNDRNNRNDRNDRNSYGGRQYGHTDRSQQP